MIVTLAELKAHLRILTNDEDTLLTTLIAQATTAASDYCRIDWLKEDEVPETVRLAVLLMASHFYEYRDSSDKSAYRPWKHGNMRRRSKSGLILSPCPARRSCGHSVRRKCSTRLQQPVLLERALTRNRCSVRLC